MKERVWFVCSEEKEWVKWGWLSSNWRWSEATEVKFRLRWKEARIEVTKSVSDFGSRHDTPSLYFPWADGEVQLREIPWSIRDPHFYLRYLETCFQLSSPPDDETSSSINFKQSLPHVQTSNLKLVLTFFSWDQFASWTSTSVLATHNIWCSIFVRGGEVWSCRRGGAQPWPTPINLTEIFRYLRRCQLLPRTGNRCWTLVCLGLVGCLCRENLRAASCSLTMHRFRTALLLTRLLIITSDRL